MRRRTPTWQRAPGENVREVQQETVDGPARSPMRVRIRRTSTPELTIVAPTRNEQAVIGAFIDALGEALSGIHAELIVVDDSDDATPEVVTERAVDSKLKIALIHRAPGEREGGLGGAVVAGIAAARAPWVCVMDVDLQHPPAAIATLRAQAEAAQSDLVVASRFRRGGSIAGLSAARTFVSRSLVALARVAFPFRLREISDPLTGFFLVRRDALDLAALRPNGFKILLEILVALAQARSVRSRVRLRGAAGGREQGLDTGGRPLPRTRLAPPYRNGRRALRPLRPGRRQRHRSQLARARRIPRGPRFRCTRSRPACDAVLVRLELRAHRALRLPRHAPRANRCADGQWRSWP